MTKPFRVLTNGSVLMDEPTANKLFEVMALADLRRNAAVQLAETADNGVLELRDMVIKSGIDPAMRVQRAKTSIYRRAARRTGD